MDVVNHPSFRYVINVISIAIPSELLDYLNALMPKFPAIISPIVARWLEAIPYTILSLNNGGYISE